MRAREIKPFWVPPGASPDLKFCCKRCNRDLPEHAFRRMVWAEDTNKNLKWRRATALHPICKSCLVQVRGQHTKHPLYTPSADRFFAHLLSGVRGGAATRGIAVLLHKDDLLGLYLEQEGRCAMSGIQMTLESGTGAKLKNRTRPSVDRVNSSGNYTIDNIQLICAQVNLMKHGMSQVDFLRWCEKIVHHRGSTEDEILKQVS